MNKVRPTTAAELHAAIRLVAHHLPDPPPVHPRLASYVARHGVSHLTANGQWAAALDFADRLERCDSERVFGVRSDRSRDGFLRAMSRCPRSARLDTVALGRLLHRQPTAAGCRNACDWLLGSGADLDTPFQAQPNASKPVTYALGESLAAAAEKKGPRELQRLSAWAEDHSRPTQYAAMYAFKYVGMRRPEWLTTENLRPHTRGNPYDRMAATGLLLYLAIQRNPLALEMDLPEFWAPAWDYNRVEVDLLRGALRWRGFTSDGGEDFAAYFMELEQRRCELLSDVRSERLRLVLTNYWQLLDDLPSFSRALNEVRYEDRASDLIWILMASPYWEVGERAAEIAGRRATADPDVALQLRDWALDERHSAVHMGVILALRAHAQATGGDEFFFEAARSLCQSPDPQIRGYVANYVSTSFQDAPEERWPAMVERWAPVLRAGLHDHDLWAVQEIAELVRTFDAANVDWRGHLQPDRAPLLAGISDWCSMEWDDLYEALTPPDRSGHK